MPDASNNRAARTSVVDSDHPYSDSNVETGVAAPSGSGKRHRPWLGVLQILAVVALVALALVFSRAPDKEAANASFSVPAAAVSKPVVTVTSPEAVVTRLTIDLTGSIDIRNYVALTPQVSGRVTGLSASLKPGGRFRSGEVLIRIETRDFQLALNQALADVASARSTLMLKEAESAAAIDNYHLLHPGAEVPPLVARIPQIEQAKAQIAAAQARADIASLNLSRTRFSLPFDGQVVASSAEVGQVLNATQSFGEVFANSAVEVVAPIAPDDLAKLGNAIGREATVVADRRRLRAVVERVSPELDERTRFARLYLNLSGLDAPQTPPPGTFVKVQVTGPDIPNAFVLPTSAEQVNGSVWIVKDGRLVSVRPRIHGRTPAGLVIRAFDASAGVVLGAVPGAKEGLEVQLAQAAEDVETQRGIPSSPNETSPAGAG